jgi:cyclic pyranopterin phosphate synthase
MLASLPGLADLSMTTNGILLEQYAPELASAGLKRLEVSWIL